MAMDGSYETKLLRILIGYLHVSVLHQLAQMRHGKPFPLLAPEEQIALETELASAAGRVAHALSEESLKGDLQVPPMVH